jgi:hypothetical protein
MDRISSYPCSVGALSGGEICYKLHSPVSGTIRASLTSRGADLDLIVVGADEIGGCDLSVHACLAASQVAGPGGVEEVTFASRQGDIFYLIVDSPTSSAGSFTLDVDCEKHL